ncbi:lectin 2 [Lactarius sanguifluus]|nr:lectin 2 [Lactarius sanguifluus]
MKSLNFLLRATTRGISPVGRRNSSGSSKSSTELILKVSDTHRVAGRNLAGAFSHSTLQRLNVNVRPSNVRYPNETSLPRAGTHIFPTLRAGLADIVDFGQDGVVILRNGFNVQSFLAIKDYGYNAGGWRIENHVRLVGDVTGNGADDLVEFGEAGVLVSTNNGDNTFTSPVKLVLKDFGYDAGGWRVEKHIRYLADIRGVGRSDIVGFGHGGVIVSKNDGNAKFNPVYLALGDFGYRTGWRLERHLRFIGVATKSGHPDIIGFGDKSVFIGRNNGDGTFAPAQAVINSFCYDAGGWRIEQHPRFVADLTGDGKVDVIGCGHAGVYASLNKGDGTFGPVNLVVNTFGTKKGWKVDKHPRFIADLTGDKRGDIIGFGDAGVYVAYNNGNGTFQPGKLVLSDFGVQQGWQVNKHPRFVVDLTGDGRADILGFRENSVFVAYNDGKGGFPSVKTLTSELSFSGGK